MEQFKLAERKSQKDFWEGPIDFKEQREELELESTLKIIECYVKDPENFLGEGGAGKVFNIGDQCIKLMKNRHSSASARYYNLGNTPQQEFAIQATLNEFEANGVFSPSALRFYVGDQCSGIVMERLDAANLQTVLNGKESVPDGFDIEDFFFRLENYIGEMHDEFGIIHNDLEPRNVMIDRETGFPRVIDFGRSLVFKDKPENFDHLAKRDFDNINRAYELVKKHLDKNSK